MSLDKRIEKLSKLKSFQLERKKLVKIFDDWSTWNAKNFPFIINWWDYLTWRLNKK